MNRWQHKRTVTVSFLALLVVGCASTNQQSGGIEPVVTPEVFKFQVKPVMISGAMTNVDVDIDPADARDGMYKGGFVRLDMTGNPPVAKNIVWQSNSPFSITFTALKDNKGNGGGGGKACGNHPADSPVPASGAGPYELTCEVNKALNANKTYTIKYSLTAEDRPTGSKFKLDPVIIVDR